MDPDFKLPVIRSGLAFW